MFKKKCNHKNMNILPYSEERTFWQRYADVLSDYMGSWAFLLVFIFLLFIWIVLNILAWKYTWDPYPFILLNLTLSSVSALQAPIILMSQNRQAERDRINANYDYSVNKKAEEEIRDMQKDLDEIKELIRNLN